MPAQREQLSQTGDSTAGLAPQSSGPAGVLGGICRPRALLRCHRVKGAAGVPPPMVPRPRHAPWEPNVKKESRLLLLS